MQAFTGGCGTRATATGYAYARRQPEKTALYQVFHRHLPGFERMWAATAACAGALALERGGVQGSVPPLQPVLAIDARPA
jgi:hypothetical protein